MAAKMTAEAAVLARICLFTSSVQLGVLVFPYIPAQLSSKIAPMPADLTSNPHWNYHYHIHLLLLKNKIQLTCLSFLGPVSTRRFGKSWPHPILAYAVWYSLSKSEVLQNQHKSYTPAYYEAGGDYNPSSSSRQHI